MIATPAPCAATAKRRAEFLWRLDALCPVTRLQLRLMVAFGMSPTAAVRIQPHEDDFRGQFLEVPEPLEFSRLVPIVTDEHRAHLAAAREVTQPGQVLGTVPDRRPDEAASPYLYDEASGWAGSPPASLVQPRGHGAGARVALARLLDPNPSPPQASSPTFQ